jgi:signal peptidase I
VSGTENVQPSTTERNLQGTWGQALTSFSLSVLILLTFRWAIFEPYVIPSGSMLPTLKVLDYIYVNKFAYGLRVPFSSKWLWQRNLPNRCDVVVFRSKTQEGQFVIKRVIGLPGDVVELLESGRIRVNESVLPTRIIDRNDRYQILEEQCPEGSRHAVQVSRIFDDLSVDPVVYAVTVPEGELALFGDNRHESADSREWGTLHRNDLLGRAQGIWLSCESSLEGLPRVCNPTELRWSRMFGDFDQKALEVESPGGR